MRTLTDISADAESLNAKIIEALNATPPCSGTAFHYTTTSGLRGILSSKRVWATDHRYLNDGREMVMATTAVLAALTASRALELVELIDLIESNVKHPAFVASFSAEADSLEQWRAYGEDGQGFALGFEVLDRPRDHIWRNVSPAHWVRMEYSEPRQRDVAALFEGFVPLLAEAIACAGNGDSAPGKRAILGSLMSALAVANVMFKHHGFATEKEQRLFVIAWDATAQTALRLAALPESPLASRTTPHGEAKYIELPVGPSDDPFPLRRIVVGPKAKVGEDAVRAICNNAGLDPNTIELSRSELPYR